MVSKDRLRAHTHAFQVQTDAVEILSEAAAKQLGTAQEVINPPTLSRSYYPDPTGFKPIPTCSARLSG